jgi:hypothetical protein
MQPQPLAALDEQQVGSAGAGAEQHQHGRGPAAAFGREGGGRYLHRAGGGRQLAQPARHRVSPGGTRSRNLRARRPPALRPTLLPVALPVPGNPRGTPLPGGPGRRRSRPAVPLPGGPPVPRRAARHENGPGLTSRAAVCGSVGPSP